MSIKLRRRKLTKKISNTYDPFKKEIDFLKKYELVILFDQFQEVYKIN